MIPYFLINGNKKECINVIFYYFARKIHSKKTIDFFYFSYGRHVAAKPAFHTSLSAHRPLFKIFQFAEKNTQDICFFLLFMHKKHSTRPALRGVPIWRRRLFLTISFSANCSGQLYDRLPFFHSRQSPFSLLLQLLHASP